MSYYITITLEFDRRPDKEDVVQYLHELIEDDSLDYRIESLALIRSGVEL